MPQFDSDKPPEDPVEFNRWVEIGKREADKRKNAIEEGKLEVERMKLEFAKSPLMRIQPLLVPIVAAIASGALGFLAYTIKNSVGNLNEQTGRIVTALNQIGANESAGVDVKAEVAGLTTKLAALSEATKAQQAASNQSAGDVKAEVADLTTKLAALSEATKAQQAASETKEKEIRDIVSDLQAKSSDEMVTTVLNQGTQTRDQGMLKVITGSLDRSYVADSSQHWVVTPVQHAVTIMITFPHGVYSDFSIESDADHQIQSASVSIEKVSAGFAPFKSFAPLKSCPVEKTKAKCELNFSGATNLQITITTNSDDHLTMHLTPLV